MLVGKATITLELWARARALDPRMGRGATTIRGSYRACGLGEGRGGQISS